MRTCQRFRTLALVLAALAAISACQRSGSDGLPAAESEAYEQTVRRFYRGLGQLEVGLLDAAVDELRQATELAPGEPAAWANLGLAHGRLGAYDEALAATTRACGLAPEASELVFLASRLETARGRRDEGIALLRRAVELDPANLPARSALIVEVEGAGGPAADAEAQRLLEELARREPDNLAVLVDRARLAAKRSDAASLDDSVRRLGRFAAGWPPEVAEQYRGVEQAATAGDFSAAARAMAFLRNVLVRVPEFLESRRRITSPAELIAEPIVRFLRLPTPLATPSPADRGLAYALEAVGDGGGGPWSALVAFSPDGDSAPALFAAGAAEVRRVDAAGASLPFPGGTAGTLRRSALLAVDWNNDFRLDLVAAGPGGLRLFLQADDGTFRDEEAAAGAPPPLALDATGAWAADVDMDGDVDGVVGVRGAAPSVLRNNGDGTWLAIEPFPGIVGLAAFAWGDADDDGDPDAVAIDGDGRLRVLANGQAGRFEEIAAPLSRRATAVALADVDADGRLDVVTLADGAVRRASLGGEGWSEEAWTTWPEAPGGLAPGDARLALADLDNNGAVDLLASAAGATALWLADERRALERLPAALDAEAHVVLDLDGDGLLDLAGLAAGQPVRFMAAGSAGYHFHAVRPRALRAAGDQRINSFAVGGTVEIRSGRLFQKQSITGPTVHFGLGERTAVDVTRIVWPNGVAQGELDLATDRTVIAEQRLKGSCPWVFADDGSGMRFVTDFLWRSPLGLRINAGDTAGVTQTEDWVKVRGDQLVAQGGVYDVRITAELWETHYVDHVSLLVVDRPADLEVFVDERFVPAAPPKLALHATRPPRPVARAWDHHGREVTGLVAARDGRTLAGFERGRYQGVAEDHFVEVELGGEVPRDRPAWLVAHGWIYPTDSSINMAIGQGTEVAPRGLSLAARDASGRWVEVASDLGFPAGKNKTVLIDLGLLDRAGLRSASRLRLSTNLEIYWDSIGTAVGVVDARLETRRLSPSRAELAFRGFSQSASDRRDLPEIPLYDRIANTAPRWRDLVGHYTRFGDVRELLAEVEDRYVILNAGDELRLTFPAPPPPPRGRARDFVLIGDGWNKDGDFNTGHSKTVTPLPSHADASAYRSATGPATLEEDPVYRRHREDWRTYHTRYVTPRAFLDGLRITDLSERKPQMTDRSRSQ